MINFQFALWSAILSATIFVTYVISYCIRLGIPSSVSASYYNLKHHILFTLAMWLSGLLIIPGIELLSDTHTRWFGYMATVGMLLVGAAPRFKSRHQRPVHTLGAILAILGTTLWVSFHRPVLLVLWVLFAIYALYVTVIKKVSINSPRNKTRFVAEITDLIVFYAAFFDGFYGLSSW